MIPARYSYSPPKGPNEWRNCPLCCLRESAQKFGISLLIGPYLDLTLRQFELSFNYGDLQLLPEVDQLPQIEVPYPITNGGQQF